MGQQCDSRWGRLSGMSITATDTPGWHIEIDLSDTAWADLVVPFSRQCRRKADWIECEVREGRFIGDGGSRNLNELLQRFLAIVKTD